MRTIRFRDVLYAVAQHTGQPPTRGDFFTNQAIAIGVYVDQWLRREWSARDWPEWTKTTRASVGGTHIVNYDIPTPTDVQPKERIGKVLKVYLVDPATTVFPVEAPDWRLTNTGIHCGFKHGTHVWIKYIPPPPRVTAEAWQADRTYSIDDPVYLPRTGECYRSTFNNNQNHEPAPRNTDRDGITLHAAPPTSEIKTPPSPGIPGVPVQNQILDVFHIVALDSLTEGSSFIEVRDEEGTLLGDAFHTHAPGDTQISIITDLHGQLDADLSGFEQVSLDTDELAIRLSDDSKYQTFGRAGWTRSNGITVLDKVLQVQAFNPGVAAVPPTPQETVFTFTEDQAVEGAVYTMDVVDQAGLTHSFEYTALENDSVESIMAGLSTALVPAAGEDPFLERISFDIDNDSKELTVFSTPVSVDVKIRLPGQPRWELVLFPAALFDPVVRGAVADTLKEWGQTQEGTAEEQQVQGETELRAQTFAQTDSPLTEQNAVESTYKP